MSLEAQAQPNGSVEKTGAIKWLEQARLLVAGENYHSHTLLHKGFVYTQEELARGPWVLVQLGDSYGSGFLNDTEDENGNAEHYPHGQVIANTLSEALDTNVLYIKTAQGGHVIKNAIDQINTYEQAIPEEARTLDREAIINIVGNDAFNKVAHDVEFTKLLEEFLKNPLNIPNSKPIPPIFFEKVESIVSDYREMLATLIDSSNVDLVKRVTFNLLPKAGLIDRNDAIMDNASDDQKQRIRRGDKRDKHIKDHFYSKGAEVINALLLATINDFFLENSDRINFDVNVVDTFAVLDKEEDFRGEHPTKDGHDKIADHYLSRCVVEEEVTDDEGYPVRIATPVLDLLEFKKRRSQNLLQAA